MISRFEHLGTLLCTHTYYLAICARTRFGGRISKLTRMRFFTYCMLHVAVAQRVFIAASFEPPHRQQLIMKTSPIRLTAQQNDSAGGHAVCCSFCIICRSIRKRSRSTCSLRSHTLLYCLKAFHNDKIRHCSQTFQCTPETTSLK